MLGSLGLSTIHSCKGTLERGAQGLVGLERGYQEGRAGIGGERRLGW